MRIVPTHGAFSAAAYAHQAAARAAARAGLTDARGERGRNAMVCILRARSALLAIS